MQLILPDVRCRVLNWRWNASCVFDSDRESRDEAKIWHFHTWKAWKIANGRELFLPFYERLLADDRFGIRAIPLPGKMLKFLPQDWFARLNRYWTWKEPL
mgnify:CR=1 FL=1